MTTFDISLPNSIYDAVKEVSSNEDISMNQFVVSAVIEKLSVAYPGNYIEKRGMSGDVDRYGNVLAKAPTKINDKDD